MWVGLFLWGWFGSGALGLYVFIGQEQRAGPMDFGTGVYPFIFMILLGTMVAAGPTTLLMVWIRRFPSLKW